MEKAESSPERDTLGALNSNLEAVHPRMRAELLIKAAQQILNEDAARCGEICREALVLAKRYGSRKDEGSALFILGDINRTAGEHRTALRFYAESLECFKATGSTVDQGRCLRRLGDVHYYVSNFNLSMRYYLRALRIFKDDAAFRNSQSSRLQTGHLMATIGNVLRETGDLDNALHYYRRCRDAYIQENYLEGIPGILYNMGNVYQTQGYTEKASEAFQTALSEACENDDLYLASLAHSSLGSVFMAQGNFNDAERHFTESLQISERLGRRRGILTVAVKLAALNRKQGDLEKAAEFLDRGEKVANKLDDRKNLADILAERALVLKDSSQYEDALNTCLAFQKLNEELHSEKRIRELDILRLRYETEDRDRKISRLRRERTIQRRMIAAAVAGLAFAGASLVSVYRNMRFRTRVNKELESKNRELATAYSQAEKLSETDALTGLANRRAMMSRLSHEEARTSRTGRGFGVVLADIDDFKKVNDRYGHACGDQILVQLARRFKTALRNQDMVSRWGGEEFLFLLPETTIRGSENTAEKIRTLVAGRPFQWESRQIRLTLTFGVSQGGTVKFDKALMAADQAMYRGKNQGKNQVVVSREPI